MRTFSENYKKTIDFSHIDTYTKSNLNQLGAKNMINTTLSQLNNLYFSYFR